MNIEAMYQRIPPITRFYVTGVLLTMLGCQLHLFNKFQLFFSWKLFWQEQQYWRLISTYFYFGKLSLDTLFHLYFLLQYCQTLEDDSFRGRRADFLYFMLLSVLSLTVLISNKTLAVIFDLTQEIPFLSQSLTFTLTYLWSRRNPSLRMSFLGLFSFNAPYLPWTLIGFTVVLHSVIPWADILGFVVGHLYYYLEDVYPTLPQTQGYRLLKTPEWFFNLVQGRPTVNVEPLPDLQMDQLDNNVQ